MGGLVLNATAMDTRIKATVSSTMYTMSRVNFLNGETISKSGNRVSDYRRAFALETQHFPDTPNQNNFPSTLIHSNEEYNHTCIY